MNQQELYTHIQDQYNRIHLDEDILFIIKEELIGKIDITSTIYQVLQDFQPFDADEFINPDGSFGYNPYSPDHIKYRVVINSNFDEISISTTLGDIYIQPRNENPNQDIKGNLIRFYSNNDTSSSNTSIIIKYLSINKLQVHSSLLKFDAKNIKCNKIEFNDDEFKLEPTIKINEIFIVGLMADIKIKYLQSTNINLLDSYNYENSHNYLIYNCRIDSLQLHSLNNPNIDISYGKYDSIDIEIPDKSELINFHNFESKKIKIQNNVYNHGTIKCIKFSFINNIESLLVTGASTILSTYVKLLHLEMNHLSFQNGFKGEISNFIDITELNISHLINNGELMFRNIHFKISEISKLNKFANKNSTKLKFKLTSSILNNTFFINCIFPDSIYAHEIDISRTILVDSDFPINVISTFPKIKNRRIKIYQQLKKLYENIGDKETASVYRRKELNIKLITLASNARLFILNLPEIFNLGINSLTNKHGQSWWRAFCVILVYAFIFYGFFLNSIEYQISWSKKGVKTYFELLSHIFQFLIPGFIYPSDSKLIDLLGGFDLGNKLSKLGGWSQFLILFNDIIAMPYLIYQFITAFRRHGGR